MTYQDLETPEYWHQVEQTLESGVGQGVLAAQPIISYRDDRLYCLAEARWTPQDGWGEFLG